MSEYIDRSSKSKFQLGYSSSSTSVQQDWLRLIRSRRWSRRQKYELLKKIGSPLDVLRLSDHDAHNFLGEYGFKGKKRVENSLKQEFNVDPDHDLELMHRDGVSLITIMDSDFPDVLKELNDPPLALFSKGDLGLIKKPKVALVGSRRPSPVGSSIASKISKELASLGIVIVSGLALGVDAVGHQGALSVDGGTIAVLGSGIDIAYPARNSQLFTSIEKAGLLLSEYPPGFKPTKYSFPDRNRLVSGLSLGVVIIEAADKSGTLITARLAMEQNREVMVVPGPAVSDQYVGSHRLIRDGAALVSSAKDVLEELYSGLKIDLGNYPSIASTSCVEGSLTKTQLSLFRVLDYVPMSLDSIVTNSGLTHSLAVETLLELELDGVVASSPEGGYIRRA